MQMINKRSTEFRMRSLWQCHKLRSISAKINKKRNNNISVSQGHCRENETIYIRILVMSKSPCKWKELLLLFIQA